MSIPPSLFFVLFTLLLYCSTLLLSISIAHYASQMEQRRVGVHHPSLRWYLVGIPAGFVFLGWLFFRTSYYDYFVLSMGMESLFAVWLTALMLAALPSILFAAEGWRVPDILDTLSL